ncbi:MAG: phage Gp37/Gp68 family protein [Chloroflexota bacterium]
MGQKSTIEWTDHTFNPWWGCVKVSKGCTNCYAETWANRYGHDVWGQKKSRRTFSDTHWKQPLKWDKVADNNKQRERVFCASMADAFEDNCSVESERQRLWRLIECTSMLDWLLLTKRPENMKRLAPWNQDWPSNVWALTSVEDQEQAEKRIPSLVDVPAVVRGLSVEPLLGPVDLRPWLDQIQWVIVGGESGRQSRPMHPEWVRCIQQQCRDAKVPFFFKQWGNWIPSDSPAKGILVQENPGVRGSQDCYMKRVSKKDAGRLLDGEEWNQLPQANLSMTIESAEKKIPILEFA